MLAFGFEVGPIAHVHFCEQARALDIFHFGINRKRPVIGRVCLLTPSELEKSITAPLMGSGEIGGDCRRSFIGGQGFLVSAELEENIAAFACASAWTGSIATVRV